MTVGVRLGRAAGWAIAGGVLLAVAHFSAIPFWQAILSLLFSYVPESVLLRLIGVLILIIVSLGGIAVIIAGLLFLQGHSTTGRLLIGFGAGFSFLTFLIYLVSALMRGIAFLTANTLLVLVGLFLSIYARGLAR